MEEVEEEEEESKAVSIVEIDTLDELAPANDPKLLEDLRLLTLNTLRKRLDNVSLVPSDISDRMETDWLTVDDVEVMEDRRRQGLGIGSDWIVVGQDEGIC